MHQPNVLFIISDQHNAKWLQHEGHTVVQTPHLDRLAREGTRFQDAVCNNPVCTPSRMCFLSGQYAHNHGYYALSGPAPDFPTFLGHFREHGYRSAAIGKIHCPPGWVERDCDRFEETAVLAERTAGYADFLAAEGLLAGDDHDGVLVDGQRVKQTLDGCPSELSFAQSQEGWIAQEAIRVMEQARAADQPFCLQASLPRPHQCATPCQEFWDL